MNLELYSVQFINPETNEIITFTLKDYFVKDATGKLLPRISEEYIQASYRAGIILAGGIPRLKELVPAAKTHGDKECHINSGF